MSRGVVAVLLLVCAGQAGAQQLTLDAAVASALRQHPTLAGAQAVEARAHALGREASAALLPALSLDGSVTRFEEPMLVAPLHGFDPHRLPVFDETLVQGVAALGYTAFDGGGRRARLAAAQAAVAAAGEGVESARQALIAEVVTRYASLVAARELGAAHGARLRALEQERERAARLLEQGRVARVVVLRAEATLSGARAEQASVGAQVTRAEHDLARVMGVAGVDVAGRPIARVIVRGAAPSAAGATERALAAHPELRRLRAQSAAARAAEAEAAAQWWPRVQLGGRYTRYASGAGDAGGEWQTGVQLSYAVFTGGGRAALVERRRAETRLADAELATHELRVAAAVDAALAALSAAQARVAAWQDAVTQSEEVVRIERLSLDAGSGVQTDYLIAEAELLRARAALTDARVAELLAHVELARAMGELTPAWLAAHVETQA